MFQNIGFTELLVIFLVALIIFGPSRLPELGRGLGKAIREFREATRRIEDEVQETVRQLDREASPPTAAAASQPPAPAPVPASAAGNPTPQAAPPAARQEGGSSPAASASGNPTPPKP